MKVKHGTGISALVAAALNGHIHVVEFLLDRGENIEIQGRDGLTPLTASAGSGEKDVIDYLVDRGADINARDGQYSTALISACSHGNKAEVECLLDRGADCEIAFADGRSPSTIALQVGQRGLSELMKDITSASRHFRKVRKNPAVRKILEGVGCDVASASGYIGPSTGFDFSV
jgi:ankyrin repeat protein